MIDGATAVQEAVFTALNVPAITAGGASVYQHVPEATPDQPLPVPLVVIADLSLEPQGGKDGGLDLAAFDIVTIVREPDRAALSALQALVRAALDEQPISATGAVLSPPRFLGADGELLEDGETYMGTQRFETYVQPA